MLEAVNECMTAVGTTPVNTLEVSGLTDAAIAKDVIESQCREVQTHGWWFNTTRGYMLTPSANQIAVPPDALRISPALPSFTGPGETRQFVTRENKLYDLNANSYVFAVTVRADIVWLQDFEKLPESARRYITVRAARIFQTKILGDEQLGVFTSVHEAEAFQALKRDHLVAAPSQLYMDRILTRFSSVRPDPVGHGGQPQQRQQRGQ